MHIPQHVLDPATCAITGAISAAALSHAVYRFWQEPIAQKLPLMALTGVSVLLAQSLNFPITSGTSGHFLGGALAGVLLGPWAGILVMAAIVTIQCVAFGDGGLSSLGANILNMAVIGSGAGHAIYHRVAHYAWSPRAMLLAAAFAAGGSVLASAITCSLELSLGAGYSPWPMLAAMVPVHSLIAIAEMFATGVVLALTLQSPEKCTWRTATLGLASAALLAIALIPFASQLPDGLESCLAQAASWVTPL